MQWKEKKRNFSCSKIESEGEKKSSKKRVKKLVEGRRREKNHENWVVNSLSAYSAC